MIIAMGAFFSVVAGGLIFLVMAPLMLTLFVVVPWWSLIDLLRRNDIQNGRVIWGLCLVFFWGLASIFYSLLSTHSRALRLTTVVCLFALPMTLILVFVSLFLAQVTSSETAMLDTGRPVVAALI